MPRYDYVCDTCDGHLEEYRPIDEQDITAGSECVEAWMGCTGKLVRQFQFATAFKGPGFYSTDKKVKDKTNG